MEDDAECSVSMGPRQGDYLPDVRELPKLDVNGKIDIVSTPEGVVIDTQCCDLARGGNGHVLVSPVVILSGDRAAFARSGRTSRFVPIFELGSNYFADLGTVGSVENKLLEQTRRVTIMDDEARHKFAQRVGRRFSRFPLPDELNSMMRPLKELVRSKAGNARSPFGQVLDHLSDLRLHVEGGFNSAKPWQLTLLLVLEDGRLPILPAEPVRSMTPVGSARRKPQTVAELASVILQLEKYDPRLWDAWLCMGDAIVDIMRPKLPLAIGDLTVEVLDEHDLSSFRKKRTYSVDFDDLSEPVDDAT